MLNPHHRSANHASKGYCGSGMEATFINLFLRLNFTWARERGCEPTFRSGTKGTPATQGGRTPRRDAYQWLMHQPPEPHSNAPSAARIDTATAIKSSSSRTCAAASAGV